MLRRSTLASKNESRRRRRSFTCTVQLVHRAHVREHHGQRMIQRVARSQCAGHSPEPAEAAAFGFIIPRTVLPCGVGELPENLKYRVQRPSFSMTGLLVVELLVMREGFRFATSTPTRTFMPIANASSECSKTRCHSGTHRP